MSTKPGQSHQLQSELEWTLLTLAPAYAGAADAVTRPDCLVGRLGAHCLLRLDDPGAFLARTWQKLRPLREQAWRYDRDEGARQNVTELLLLWGLIALEAASVETQEALWGAFDEIIRDAAKVDRVAMTDQFWLNMLHRYAQLLPRLLEGRPDGAARLAQTLRPHLRLDLGLVDVVLVLQRGGIDQAVIQSAMAIAGADLAQTLQAFLIAEKQGFSRRHLNPVWIEGVKEFASSLSSEVPVRS